VRYCRSSTCPRPYDIRWLWWPDRTSSQVLPAVLERIVPEPNVVAVPQAHAEGFILEDVVVDAEVPLHVGRPVPAHQVGHIHLALAVEYESFSPICSSISFPQVRGGWRIASSLPYGIQGHSMVVWNNWIYVIGVWNGPQIL